MPRSIDGFIFDLDGTVYLGNAALPGAVEAIAGLRRKNKKVVFVSNNPLNTRYYYAEKLTRLGIPTPPEEVITSAYVLGYYLAKHHPTLRLYVVGEDSLKGELRAFGLTVVEELLDQDIRQVINPMGIDAVVVAFDRTIDYRKINTAYQALKNGAAFFATNADKACPMPDGSIPDAGATITALEYITGRKLELLAGKPSPIIMQVALDLLQLPAARCMMTGDRLETDIRMGQEAGMCTAVALTGVTKMADVSQTEKKPDFAIHQLNELLDLTE